MGHGLPSGKYDDAPKNSMSCPNFCSVSSSPSKDSRPAAAPAKALLGRASLPYP